MYLIMRYPLFTGVVFIVNCYLWTGQWSSLNWSGFAATREIVCIVPRHHKVDSAVSVYEAAGTLLDCANPGQWGLKCKDLLLQHLGLKDSPGFCWGGPVGGRLMTKERAGKESCGKWKKLHEEKIEFVFLATYSLLVQIAKGNIHSLSFSFFYHHSLMFHAFQELIYDKTFTPLTKSTIEWCRNESFKPEIS